MRLAQKLFLNRLLCQFFLSFIQPVHQVDEFCYGG